MFAKRMPTLLEAAIPFVVAFSAHGGRTPTVTMSRFRMALFIMASAPLHEKQ